MKYSNRARLSHTQSNQNHQHSNQFRAHFPHRPYSLRLNHFSLLNTPNWTKLGRVWRPWSVSTLFDRKCRIPQNLAICNPSCEYLSSFRNSESEINHLAMIWKATLCKEGLCVWTMLHLKALFDSVLRLSSSIQHESEWPKIPLGLDYTELVWTG